MTEKKFYTAAGRLTAYALACGRAEIHETDTAFIYLCKQDGFYHVSGWLSDDTRIWDTFDTLTDARAHYRAQIRKSKLRAKEQ